MALLLHPGLGLLGCGHGSAGASCSSQRYGSSRDRLLHPGTLCVQEWRRAPRNTVLVLAQTLKKKKKKKKKKMVGCCWPLPQQLCHSQGVCKEKRVCSQGSHP